MIKAIKMPRIKQRYKRIAVHPTTALRHFGASANQKARNQILKATHLIGSFEFAFPLLICYR